MLDRIRDMAGGISLPSGIKKPIVIAAAVVIVAAAAVRIVGGSSAKVSQETLSEGVAYIQSLESRDVSDVKETLSEIRKAERRALLEAGELSIWDQFEDYAILGDSRAVGFYYYDYLEESRCLTHGGATIRDVESYMDRLVALQPKYVFMCYGLNDVSIGYWDTPEEYVAEFKEVMASIWENVPDCQIIVSSILIARDPAFETSTKWYEIPDFNVALKAMCEENGYSYADNTDICEEYADLWDSDGIHVNKAFYPYWATNLIAEVDVDYE